MKTGDRVRDTYTGRIGTLIGYDPVMHRATVAFEAADGRPSFKMQGCASWFQAVEPVEEESTP